jgi:diguanylate cyclase (GGDEF)-like protein
MLLDLPTLFAATVLANALAGVLLLLSWTQYRNIPSLAVWGVGFALGSIGTGLLGARGNVHDFYSIIVANALFAAAYGIMWGGVRTFVGRRTPIPAVFAGAAFWLLACQIDFVYHSLTARIAVMAMIVSAYLLMSAWEFWRSREHASFSRWPIIGVLLIHAAAFFARIPLASAWLERPEATVLRLDWLAAITGEVFFFVFCFAYLLGSMAHERMVLRHRADAYSDELTGVANRRQFFSRGENLVRRARMGGQPATLILFDLDAFKEINDTHGHPVGDHVLKAFCEVAVGSIRPGDLFARVGGEEFACLLVNTSSQEAGRIAERIRAVFAASEVEFGQARVHATVSAGIASLDGGTHLLSELILVADRALYRAKAQGGNRLERGATVGASERRTAAAG